jgi:hypothetical protein
MIRPESLSLRPPDAEGPGPGIVGQVVNVAFLGNHTRVTVATSAGDLVMVRPHDTTARRNDQEEELGEEVCVWWYPDDAALISDGALPEGAGTVAVSRRFSPPTSGEIIGMSAFLENFSIP